MPSNAPDITPELVAAIARSIDWNPTRTDDTPLEHVVVRLILDSYGHHRSISEADLPEPHIRHEVGCPSCGATIRARMADAPEQPSTGPSPLPPCGGCWERIDPAEPHVVVIQQVEQHQKPGEITVHDARVLLARHAGCA